MTSAEEKEAFRAKLRSIQFAGMTTKPRVVIDKKADTKKVEVLNESGTMSGFQTYHGSGMVDGTVVRPSVEVNPEVVESVRKEALDARRD